MTIESITRDFASLEACKQQTKQQEQLLQKQIADLVNAWGVRHTARTLGISVPYAHDLRHQRRKVSAKVIDKLIDTLKAA